MSPGEFHLRTFFSTTDIQLPLFLCVLLMYLLSVLGNLIISLLICLVSQLHTPMYIFLCCLSIQDIVYVSTVLPKLLAITITGDTIISFSGCFTQIFLFAFCIDAEFFLLTSMAYDRYVAICIPLRYSLLMNKRVCAILISTSWFAGFLNSLMFTLLMLNLTFCNPQEINHFFCDAPTMLKLSSTDTAIIRTLISIEGVSLGLLPFILILTSYMYILSTILKIQSSSGRLKTFSSCSSHLTVVVLFYGTSLTLYMKPESGNSQELDKLLSMLYVIVVPMLNPLVYSLRNREVIKAMNKILGKNIFQR
ncbi:olfactory receptor 1019-like [Bombina bombina]|uniref:olfactory receptor 1019-like n=1 Tax=Bombina bombina TaxID=8345 RepID=UPI00235ABA59|nr:olfactory receptor 1019-like [Bombina bombina]